MKDHDMRRALQHGDRTSKDGMLIGTSDSTNPFVIATQSTMIVQGKHAGASAQTTAPATACAPQSTPRASSSRYDRQVQLVDEHTGKPLAHIIKGVK